MVAVLHSLTSTDAEAEEWRLRCDMAAVFRVVGAAGLERADRQPQLGDAAATFCG